MSDNNGNRQNGSQGFQGFESQGYNTGLASQPSGGFGGYTPPTVSGVQTKPAVDPYTNPAMLGPGAGGAPPQSMGDMSIGNPQPITGGFSMQKPAMLGPGAGGAPMNYGEMAKPMQLPMQNAGYGVQNQGGMLSAPPPQAAPAPAPSYGGGNNPNLQGVADSISRNFNRNLTESVMPAIRGSSFVNGQVGGDRQGIAEGLAASRSQEGLASALAQMYSGAYESDANRQLQGSIASMSNQTQRDLGMMNNDTQRALGFGNLGISQQQANTARMLGLGNLGVAQDQNDTSRLLGLGNLGLGYGNLGLNQQQANNNFYTAQRGQDLQQQQIGAGLLGQGQQGLIGGMQNLFNSYGMQNGADQQQLGWLSGLFGQMQGANGTQTGQQGYSYNPTQQWLGTAAQVRSLFSDERLKENINKVGKTDEGLNVYTYNYKGDSTPQMGVMAQEVEQTKPEAVATHESGFKMVNYGLLG